MNIKYKKWSRKAVCFFLSAGLFFGIFQKPLLAGEVAQKEVENISDLQRQKDAEFFVHEREQQDKVVLKSRQQEFQEEKSVQEEPETQEAEEPATEAECVEVSSLTELVLAVNEQGQEEMEDFSGKSLLVLGDIDLENMELLASGVLRGYGLTVLIYDTENAAREEFKTLKKKGMAVEINAMVDVCGDIEVSAVKENGVDGNGKKEEGKKEGGQNERESVTVAVLDSGYDAASFGDLRIKGGIDFTGENDIADRNGHGTAMAGIVLCNTKDEINVMPVKVADETGFTTVLHMYMGMRYAMEQGADIINISMSAYKSAHSGILEETVKEASEKGIMVVVSAGNQGEDTKNYTPANIRDAVTVSSAGSDKVRASYSNYGETVDYCAYGAVELTGISGQKVTATGTSVSAAIVSSLMAKVKSRNPGMKGEELLGFLDSMAEDLGDAGTDIYYGRGFLTFDSVQAKEDEKVKEELPGLLTCEWRSLSDDALNELILEAEDIYKKRFLDDMSKEEREELLGRKDILYNHKHGAVVVPMSEDCVLGEEKRFEGTLYEYLYSELFKEFQVNGSAQKEHDGANQTIHISARSKGDYFVNLTTSQNKTSARLYVWVNGYSANPTSKYILHAEGTDAGAFAFSDISVSANGSGDLNDITVGGIKVSKAKHTTLKDKYQTRTYVIGDPDYKEDETGDGGLGGFIKPESDSCSENSQKFSFKFTHNDGEHSSSNGNYALTYQLNYSGVHDTTSGKWGKWTTLEDNTCLKNGKKVHSRELTCNHCKKVVKTESKEEKIPAHGHLFAEGVWSYDTCPVTGIPQGVRYQQCTYNCGEAGWRINYQYLNEIYYHVMDSEGRYPSDYTLYASSYYPGGAVVPGYTYDDAEGKTNHRITVLPECTAPEYALRQYVDVSRKEYTVTYNGNGSDGGNMQEQRVYFGQEFSLPQNGFSKTGFDFAGFSLEKEGKGEIFSEGQKIAKNLTGEDFGVVTIYAQWRPHTYRITLDSQGAFSQGTKEVYQKYGQYYSKEKDREVSFANNKIVVPEKARADESLMGKERKQKFAGYFTEKGGKGYAMIKEDGSLISNIKSSGNYRYFTKDATVYACYQDMSAIQFSDNLTPVDRKVVGEGETILPKTKWKEHGKDLTVFYEGAEVFCKEFKAIYRLLGWSLTPEISGEEELVLSPEKTSYTFTGEEDVTLYAQWDSSYNLAYIGNTQTRGTDYLQPVKAAVDKYTFCGNEKEETELPEGEGIGYFEKEVEKETFDIVSGEAKDKDGNLYREVIPYSFQGWSMFSDKKEQEKNKQYKREEGERESREILLDAVTAAKETEGRGLTFGVPASEFGNLETSLLGEKTPCVNLFAIWDEFPQIKASDLYFSTEEARSGRLTQDYLLGLAEATDRELEGITDEKGTMHHGEDAANDTSFVIIDYREEDFTGAEGSMSFTVTYVARDAVGNETRKTVTVHLIDTTAKNYDKGKVRFISKEHIDTLGEKSVWRTEEYSAILERALKNRKRGEEYTSPSALEQLFGAKAVKKPGSGTWDTVLQVWKFTHSQVLEAQNFMADSGIKGSQQAFLDKFGFCRVQ
ncbi:MAG: S8 family serine peptidase [Roseburia sp.]|nr:S8 family serine peptidase [Roseburia sp.]